MSVAVAPAAVRLPDDRSRAGTRSGERTAPPRRPGDDRRVRGLERRRRGGQHRAGAPRAELGRQPLASIDPEEYYDFQVTRPHVRHADGVTRQIEWQTTRLSVAALPGTDRHVVLVNGIEPNLRWRSFCGELLELRRAARSDQGHHARCAAHRHPAHPAHPGQRDLLRPHVRRRAAVEPSSYQGPTGIVGVFQNACVRGRHPGRCRSGPPCRTTSRRPGCRRPRSRCCTGSRRCSTSRCRSARCPSRPRSGSAPSRRWPRPTTRCASTCASSRSRPRRDADVLPEADGDAIAADFERYLRRRGPRSGQLRPGSRRARLARPGSTRERSSDRSAAGSQWRCCPSSAPATACRPAARRCR